MQRPCDFCGKAYEAKLPTSRFCGTNCRVKNKRTPERAVTAGRPVTPTAAAKPLPMASTKVSEALEQELRGLGVADTYEAAVALGLARQLDSGAIVGAAYVSLSKEIDRRVDLLRLRAELPDDPARDMRERLEAKRLRLVEGATG